MHDQARARDLFEGSAKGFHQSGWQIAHETHGVAQQNILIAGQAQAPRGGVQRGEQLVLRENRRASQRV